MSPSPNPAERLAALLPPLPASIAKPLYAYVGLSDAALEAVRSLPATLAAAKTRQDALGAQVKDLRGSIEMQLKDQVKDLPGAVKDLRTAALDQVADLPDRWKTLPAKASGLPEQAVTRAENVPAQARLQLEEWRGLADELQERLKDSYDEYVARGERLITALRAATPAGPVHAPPETAADDPATPAAKPAPGTAAQAQKAAAPQTTGMGASKPAAKTAKPAKAVKAAKPTKKGVTPRAPADMHDPAIVELPTAAGDSETVATPIGTVHIPEIPTGP